MDKFHIKTLTAKLILLLLISFCIATSIFWSLFFMGTNLLDEYFLCSDFIYNAETVYIADLQDYVRKNNLSAYNIEQLGEWAHRKGISHFTVSRNRVLIYDSAYSDSVVLGEAETGAIHLNWQYFHSISFSDGDADVYIYADYEIRYYLLFYIVNIIVSVSIWLLLFALAIRKEIKYIQELSYSITQIGLGELNLEVPVKRNDELGILAHGLNQMRITIIQKEEKERTMKLSQEKLVLGMAHDLRTPLTGLMTFLEIAKKQTSLIECNNYIDKAYVKTTQIRDLSNQLFEFFLITSEQPIKLEEPENVEYSLGEYLSELCGLLQLDNFSFAIDGLYWEQVQIQICTDYMGRIINNIISNIKKYADQMAPIQLYTEYDTKYAAITIQNKPLKPNQYVQGTGIGVNNIRTMMSQMNGICNVSIKPHCYSITLRFPIVTIENNT